MGSFIGQSGEVITQNFDTFRFDTWRPYLWTVVFIVLTAVVLYAGVEKGIEKWSKVLMPMLFVIVAYLCVYAIFLPNSGEGYKFYFDFDFSKINADVVIAALGQAFFSLSLGMGAMMIYGSYIEKGTNLAKTSIQIASLDTLVAVLAGLVVFPAVFSFGIDPAAGPQLVFITLPTVFAQMTGGYIFSICFFLLLAVAALTSTISILEVQIATVAEEFKMNRKLSLVLVSVIMLVVCCMCSYSLIPVEGGNELVFFGVSLFDICDMFTSYIILPLGGLLIMLFLGWFYKKEDLHYVLVVETKCSEGLFKIYYFFLRFIAPLLLLAVFLQQLGLF
jgi:NSS family neurotransmitter:Na+ symporter